MITLESRQNDVLSLSGPGVMNGTPTPISSNICPSCSQPFDKGKKRKLIDACGHERCYLCVFGSDRCPLCQRCANGISDNLMTNVPKQLPNQNMTSTKESVHITKPIPIQTSIRPKNGIKTNGYFTSYMQKRQIEQISECQGQQPTQHLRNLRNKNMLKRNERPSSMSIDNSSTNSGETSDSASLNESNDEIYGGQKLSAKNHNKFKSKMTRSTTIPETDVKLNFYKHCDMSLDDKDNDHSSTRYDRPGKLDSSMKPPSSLTLLNAQPEKLIVGGGSSSVSSPESYTSASSLSSGNDPRKVFGSSSNTSPVSTLTGFSENSSSMIDPSLRLLGKETREFSTHSVASLMSNNSIGNNTSSSSPTGSSIRNSQGLQSPLFLRRGSNNSQLSLGNKSTLTTPNAGTTTTNYTNKITISNQLVYGCRLPLQQLPLRPLFFEVPQCEIDPLFIGRQWLFKELLQELGSDRPTSGGVIISGGPGTGKTSIILQLVDYSYFGRKKDDTIYEESHLCDGITISNNNNTYSYSGVSTTSNSIYQSRLTLSHETARSCGIHVVGYHFCQAENNVTCSVPDFVHSIAAQLCQAPQLSSYRELILRSTKYQEILSLTSCIQNASNSLIKGILDPLHSLRRLGKIPNTTCYIVIDALNEAEFHKPEYGDSLSCFISKHLIYFPKWLKLIVTVRTAFQEITRNFPFHRISLDRLSVNENLQSDIFHYINYRINKSSAIKSNISMSNSTNKSTTAISTEERISAHSKFVNHLISLSRGCMLFVKLTLDLIERGSLVMKSSSYNILPINLNEVFLLSFNLRFSTVNSYDKVAPILQVLCASLYPLTQQEIYNTINAGAIDWSNLITWDEFLIRLNVLLSAQFIVIRKDGTLMFAHSSLKEWLLRREENENTKFMLDSRLANALVAFRLSRLDSPLDSDKCIELGHHILKAHLYKGLTYDSPTHTVPRDLQSFWVLFSAFDISRSLSSLRNIFCPNIKVSRLLLLAGASPDQRAPLPNKEPIIAMAAREGFIDFVSTLIDFGANIDATTNDETCMNALLYAAENGHLEVLRLLLARGATLNQVDGKGRCALVLAASKGYFEIVCHLLQCDWHDVTVGLNLAKAAQQALIFAASNGHVEICDYLLDMAEVQINTIDNDLTGHTALTAACANGRVKVCEKLLKRGASTLVLNLKGEPPLICAVSEGQWEVVELIIAHNQNTIEQTDNLGKTSLMLASAEGHLGILELLLSNGADISKVDNEGMSCLTWACIKGQIQAAQCLIVHGANVNHTDNNGKIPLDYVALHGNAELAQLLLDKGAILEHVDLCGIRPLDRAIGQGNISVIACFLKRGAKIGTQTWNMAEGKLDVLLLLLHKLMEDGSVLYKKNRLREASHRFQYALKKFPSSATIATSTHNSSFIQLKFQLYLGYSRCKRKTNEYDLALDAAERAIELKPKAFEGYYSKARALKEIHRYQDAWKEINESLNLVSPHNDIRKVVIRLKNEIDACLNDVPKYDSNEDSSIINDSTGMERTTISNPDELAIVDKVCDDLVLSLTIEDKKIGT